MELAQKCKNSFNLQTRVKGQQYYSTGRVHELQIGDQLISATVRGSGGANYSVELDLSDPEARQIAGRCTCPYYSDGHLCKHIWAVLLANDNNADGVNSPRATVNVRYDPRSAVKGEDEDVELEDDLIGVEDILPNLANILRLGSPGRKPSQPKETWRQQLAQIAEASVVNGRLREHRHGSRAARKPREIWYLINVAASQSKRDMLAIEFFHREQKKNGGWGKFKRCHIRPQQIAELPTPDDRWVAGLLIGNEPDEHADSRYGDYYTSYYSSYRGFNRSWIRPVMFDELFPRLSRTGRLVWSLDASIPIEESQTVSWDEGAPWSCQLRVQVNGRRDRLRIGGEFIRAEETRSLESAVMILEGGLVLFPGVLCRTNSERFVGWMTKLRKMGPIELPFKDRESLLRTLCAMPDIPPIACSEVVCGVTTIGDPQPHLEIASPPQRYASRDTDLWAKVSFKYGDQLFPWNDGQSALYDDQQSRLLIRSREREQELAARLPAIGFQPPKTYYARDETDFTLPARQLVEAVRLLNDEGWVVETRGVRIRRPGDFKLEVTSGVDWFELHGKVDFDGIAASLPSLLKALRNNEQFVRLDDGSQGLLPEEWLKKYGHLAQLAETSGEKLRFTASQGLLLDALLAEQPDAQLDEQYRLYRDKLRSFDGVTPAQAVSTFVGELRQYQEDGLGWLHFLRDFGFGGCLADDMGLGKTVQILALLEARRTRRLKSGENRRPSIVVVPKSLVFNWVDEAARFTPHLRTLNFTGIDRGDSHANPDEYDLLVTTYGTLRRDVVKLKDSHFDYAILDEAQAIKNSSSQAAKACRLIKADHRVAMTGTPIENHLGELWSLFDFLNPGMLGRSAAFASFARSGNGQQDSPSLELLSRAVRPFLLRRTKQQVLTELPEKLEQTLVCEMSPAERKAYDDLRDYYRVQLTNTVQKKGIAKSKIHVLEALLRLRQAACHPGLLDRKKSSEGSAKLEVLLEQLQDVVDDGHKALVFSQFTSLLAIVREHLDKRGVVYEYLDGQTRDRGSRVKRFQEDPACPLFLISLKAGGHGLNLTAAEYVFILDPWWNPAVEAQAVDRAHRIGQTQRVFAYRLIARGTVEDKILELQKSKKDLADAIVSANNSLIRSLTADDLELLLS